MVTVDKPAFLSHVYERFNARDMETVLAAMHENVLWANGMDGGYVNGRDGVRQYWTRQWAMVDPRVEPVGFSEGSNGKTVVRVHQVVRDLSGTLLLDHEVSHIFSIEDGLIKRFDIAEE
jgi:nuclear transport factor 2 (NTF2) superfamily protein